MRKWLIPAHEYHRERCIALCGSEGRLTNLLGRAPRAYWVSRPSDLRERAQLPIEDLFFRLGEPYARKSCTYGSEGGHPSIKNIFFPYATPLYGFRTTCLSLWIQRCVSTFGRDTYFFGFTKETTKDGNGSTISVHED